MPIPGARYRYAPNGVRLAFEGDKVVEAKNMTSGATHTPEEFAADAANHQHHLDKHQAEHSTGHLGQHPLITGR